MSHKIKLKPSNQSLKSRGLPILSAANLPNQKAKKVMVPARKKNQQKQLEYPNISSDSSNTMKSLTNGLDRCEDLLGALTKAPSLGSANKNTPCKKRVKINLPNTEASMNVKSLKRVAISTPVNQPPVCLNSSSNAETHAASFQHSEIIDDPKYEYMLQEKQKLEEMLKSIETDKKGIESKYQHILTEEFKHENIPKKQITNSKIPPTKSPMSKCIGNTNYHVAAKKHSPTPRYHQAERSKEQINHKESNELQQLMGRITNNLSTNSSLQRSDITESEFSQHSIKRPPKVPILTSSVQDLIIPSAANSVMSENIEKEKEESSLQFMDEKKEACKRKFDNIQEQFKKKDDKSSPIAVQITTLNYLIKELRILLGEKVELEVDRLLYEIYNIVGLLPFAVQETNSSHGEDISIQHLKNENMELCRQVRATKDQLANVQLNTDNGREKNIYIDKLLNKLDAEETSKVKLTKEIKEVQKVTDALLQENKSILKILSDKDQKHTEEMQNLISEKSILSQDVHYRNSIIEELTLTVKSHEKERRIFEISLQQRDVEIERLNELNKDLQTSVSTLLTDINDERQKHEIKILSNLTKKTFQPLLKLESNILENLSRMDSTLKAQSSIALDSTINPSIKPFTTVNQSMEPSSTFYNMTKSSSVSTLATLDNSEFRKGLDQLDDEIERIQMSLKNKPSES